LKVISFSLAVLLFQMLLYSICTRNPILARISALSELLNMTFFTSMFEDNGGIYYSYHSII